MREYEPRHVEDGLLVNGSAAWAWFRLPTHGWDLLSEGERHAHLAQAARLIGGLREATGHLIVAPRSISVRDWAERLNARVQRPTPGWAPYLAQVTEHLEGQSFESREVYLGLRIGAGARSLLDLLARRQQPDTAAPTEAALAALRGELDRMRTRVVSGCPGAKLATSAELTRLTARSLPVHHAYRSLWFGEDDRTPPGDWRHAASRWLGDRFLGYDRTDAPHSATLAVAHMPESMDFPGGSEWLHRIDALPFPVTASIRFEVLPPAKAADKAEKAVTASRDQAEHLAGTSIELPLEVAESYAGARELARDLRRGEYPLVYCWPRLVVTAPTRGEVADRALALIEMGRDLGIELVQPAGDQLALWREARPGDRVRVSAYRETLPPVTLAGSMYAASAELGDQDAPYFGWTTGTSRRPVGLDPLRAAITDAATVLSLTGRPGSGKTNAATKLVYEARLRGAWTAVVAHKAEDVAGLARLPGLGAAQMVHFDASFEGALDPFRIEDDLAEAELLAAELCRVFLPADQARTAQGVILAAVKAEATQEQRPTLRGVVNRLLGGPSELAQAAGEALDSVADKPLARTCFGGGEGQRLRLDGALTILLLDNLGLPDASSRPDEWSIPERLAVGLLRAITALVGQMLVSADRHAPKLLFLDEAWAITGSAEGRRLVERIARIGRARNLALVLATQSARDLSDERVRNNLGVKLGFRSDDEVELRAMLGLLEVEATAENMAMVRRFRPGQCLMRDLGGRIGQVQVDLVTEDLRRALDTTPHPNQEAIA